MRLKIRMPTVAVLVFFVVAAVNAQQSAPPAHTASQPESKLPAEAAQLIQEIEVPPRSPIGKASTGSPSTES